MICRKCGCTLSEADPFCPACGTPRAVYTPPQDFVAVEGEALYYRFEPVPQSGGEVMIYITSFDPASGKYMVLCPPTAVPGAGPEGYDWDESAGEYYYEVPFQDAVGKGCLVTSVDPAAGSYRQDFYPDDEAAGPPPVPEQAPISPPQPAAYPDIGAVVHTPAVIQAPPREPSPPADAPHAAVVPLNLEDSYRRSGKSRRLLLLVFFLLALGVLAVFVVVYVLPAYEQGKTIVEIWETVRGLFVGK